MSDNSIIVSECPFCHTPMDITSLPPFTRVSCPTCGEKTRVKLQFGPYLLERRLSKGGMSVLFVARDTLLDREVAVKILNEEYSSDERRIAAFEEEARVTASLSHPNIVRVLTTGRAFGRFFIAMELVPGGHFEHHIRTEERIPEARMLKLAIQIASGLKAAHEANLIHRDIKPGNILLDADGNAKIVDFGLALVTQGGTARAKEFWATPYYVPPETIEGAEEDFRSDIYAFGATLYHALAGKPPCNEESMAVHLLRAAKKNIVPLHLAHPDLSMAVCEIVNKCMAHDPADRYASYDALINDLQDAANRTKHGLIRESAGQVASRRMRNQRARRVAMASAGLAGGLAVISALAWLTKRGGDSPTPLTTGEVNPITIPAITTDLGKSYEEARDAFIERNFSVAVDRFARLFDHPELLEPTRTWAGIQALVAAMLNEDNTRARRISTELLAHLSKTNHGEAEIHSTLLPILTQIAADETGEIIEIGDAEPPRAGAAALIAWLLIGIKEWQFGDHAKAATYFETALSVALDDDATWFEIHQDIARDHLADFAILADPACNIEPQTLEAAEEACKQLDSLMEQVRTRGPITNILRAKRREATRVRNRLEIQALEEAEEAEEAEEPDGPPDDEPVIPPEGNEEPVEPHATREQILELIANYDFQKARETMLNLDEDEIPHLQRNAWMTVARSAQKFMEALAQDVEQNTIRVHTVRLRDGKTIEGIQAHPGGTLADHEGNPIPWSDIHPDSFINWHSARIPDIPEAERLMAHEAAIAFDLLVGDRQRVNRAIDNLSKRDPNFERFWKLILENFPQ